MAAKPFSPAIAEQLASPLSEPVPEAQHNPCQSRRERREVLFAKGVGGSTQKKRRPEYTEDSKVRC